MDSIIKRIDTYGRRNQDSPAESSDERLCDETPAKRISNHEQRILNVEMLQRVKHSSFFILRSSFFVLHSSFFILLSSASATTRSSGVVTLMFS